MKKCLIILNRFKEEAIEISKNIETFLEKRGIESIIIFFEKDTPCFSLEGISFVITLGGDGTVLYAARLSCKEQIPIFPINLGQFGFIAGISPSNWTEKLNDFIQGKLAVAKRTLLNIKVFRNEKEIFSSTTTLGVSSNIPFLQPCSSFFPLNSPPSKLFFSPFSVS